MQAFFFQNNIVIDPKAFPRHYPLKKNKQWAKCLAMNYFHRTILGLVGTMSSCFQKLISGGLAIIMSWYAFFEKINSREGDIYSELVYNVSPGVCYAILIAIRGWKGNQFQD